MLSPLKFIFNSIQSLYIYFKDIQLTQNIKKYKYLDYI